MSNNRPQPIPGKLISYAGMGFVALVLLLILSSSTFLTIDPGQRGVLFKRFSGGIETETIYGEGFQIVAPWNKMILYDVRTAEGLEQMQVLSKNRLTIKVELSYRYQPKPNEIGELHQ